MFLSDGEIDSLFAGTTFGMEFDCGEFDRHRPTPEKVEFCTDEVSAHTNKGLGEDPLLILNCRGGEAKIGPDDSEMKLWHRVLHLIENNLFTDQITNAGTIHMHVRIPGLLENTELLRHLVHWTTVHWPKFVDEIYKFNDTKKYNALHKRWAISNRDTKSQLYTPECLHRMDSNPNATAEEIGLLLHNHPTCLTEYKNELGSQNKVKRPCINFGHLMDIQTIEIRAFMITTDPVILWNIITFPLRFLRMALKNDTDPTKISQGLVFQDMFEFPHNDYFLEARTTLYCESRENVEKYLRKMLYLKKITLADLNYPDKWIKEGYQ